MKQKIIEALENYEGSDFHVNDSLIQFIESVQSTPVKDKQEPTPKDELEDFIQEIKNEFKDENWDYLTFIAERVRNKRAEHPTPTDGEGGFTKGEWRKVFNLETNQWDIKINNRLVCSLPNCMDGEYGKYETAANLKLIESAPAMYEALQKTLAAMVDLVRQLPTDERLADYNLDFCESAEQDAKAILNRINAQM